MNCLDELLLICQNRGMVSKRKYKNYDEKRWGKRVPKHRRAKDHILSEVESEAFLQVDATLKDKVIANLALVMGMRESEIAHMRGSWIEDGAICIPAMQPCNCGECARERGNMWTPKRPMSIRDLAMPPFVEELLNEYFQKHQALEVSRQTVYNRIISMLRKIDNKDAYPHSLRATCATKLAASGMEAAPMCYFMGWADLRYAQFYIQIARAKGEARRQIARIYSSEDA